MEAESSFHNSSLLVPILSQVDPVHIFYKLLPLDPF